MPKQFSIRAKDLTTEELYGLLRQMPKRPLLRLAELHKVETNQQTVAFDLAQHPKCFTRITFNVGFSL